MFLLQSAPFEGYPSKMVSIMSIPGGLTISQWEPVSQQERVSSQSQSGFQQERLGSHSFSTHAPSPFPHSNSTTSSSSKATSDMMLKESSSVYLPHPGNLAFPSVVARSPDCHVGPTATIGVSPQQVSTEQVNLLDMQDFPNLRGNEYMMSDQQNIVTSPTNGSSCVVPSPIPCPVSPAVSPRGKSPRLSVIPEGQPVQTPIEFDSSQQTAFTKSQNETDGQSDMLDSWLERSPNENMGTPLKNFVASEDGKTSQTSLKTNSSTSVVHATGSALCNKSSSRELDVFTHLFNDSENDP